MALDKRAVEGTEISGRGSPAAHGLLDASTEDGAIKTTRPVVFISYSRRDLAFVGELTKALEARGFDTRVDHEDIEPAARFPDRLRDFIREAVAIVCVVSPAFAASEWCRRETNEALALNKRLVPVLARETDPATVPPAIAELQWLSFLPPALMANQADTLARSLLIDVGWMREHARLAVRAHNWDQAGRPADRLMRGSELTAAEAWALAPPSELADIKPTPLQRDYITESRRRELRSLRQTRLLFAAVAIAMLFGILRLAMLRDDVILQQAALAAEAARQHVATGNGRAAIVTAQAGADTLAARAPEFLRAPVARVLGSDGDATGRIRFALFEAVESLREARRAQHACDPKGNRPGCRVTEFAFSRDDQFVATASDDKTARVWDLKTGALLAVLRHGDRPRLSEFAFSPDSRYLATGSLDDHARIWEWQKAAEQDTPWRILHHDGAPDACRLSTDHKPGNVIRADFTPDGAQVMTASIDGTIRLWSPETDTARVLCHGRLREDGKTVPDGVLDATLSADGQWIASGTTSGIAAIWHVETAALRYRTASLGVRLDVANFDRSGRRLITASDRGTLAKETLGAQIWEVTETGTLKGDARTGEPIKLIGHYRPLSSAILSGDGTRALTTANDKTARIWDTESGKTLQILQGHDDVVDGAMFSADGRLVLTWSWDGTIRLWNAASGRELAVYRGHAEQVEQARFTSDGLGLFSIGGSDMITWHLARATTVTNRIETRLAPLTRAPRVRSAEFPTAEDDDADDAEIQRKIEDAILLRDRRIGITGLAPHPTDRLIATASLDGTARVWSALGQECVRLGDPGSSPLGSAAFSPDGKLLAVSRGTSVEMWDWASGSLIRSLRQDHWVGALAFRPDGQALAVAAGGAVCARAKDCGIAIWQADNDWQAPAASLKGHRRGIMELRSRNDRGADGRERWLLLSAGSDNKALLWNASTPSDGPLHAFNHSDTVFSALWTPDGGSVITVSGDKRIKSWDAATGQEQLARRKVVNGYAFAKAEITADGHHLIVATSDGAVRILDRQPGGEHLAELARLRGQLSHVWRLALTTDGGTLATASGDGTVLLWPWPTDVEDLSTRGQKLLEATQPILTPVGSADAEPERAATAPNGCPAGLGARTMRSINHAR